MITALDSSVILDILIDDPNYADAAIGAVSKARQQGALVVCESVVAEIAPALHAKDVDLLLEEWGLTFSPGTLGSARLRGRCSGFTWREKSGMAAAWSPIFSLGRMRSCTPIDC